MYGSTNYGSSKQKKSKKGMHSNSNTTGMYGAKLQVRSMAKSKTLPKFKKRTK